MKTNLSCKKLNGRSVVCVSFIWSQRLATQFWKLTLTWTFSFSFLKTKAIESESVSEIYTHSEQDLNCKLYKTKATSLVSAQLVLVSFSSNCCKFHNSTHLWTLQVTARPKLADLMTDPTFSLISLSRCEEKFFTFMLLFFSDFLFRRYKKFLIQNTFYEDFFLFF